MGTERASKVFYSNQEIEELKQSADGSDTMGSPRSQYRLACFYDDHEDYEKAVYYYTLAAELAHPLAKFNLKRCYDWGVGVRFSDEFIFNYYRKVSGEKNNPENCEALFFLATCYEHALGVLQDLEKANDFYGEYFKKAERQK